LAKDFKSALKGVDQALKNAGIRAMNRSLTTARTKLSRDIKTETGLPIKRINRRISERKARYDRLKASLSIGIKTGISLSEFKPLVKNVKVVHKGNRKPTTHYGVSVKIGSQGRTLVPGGFLALGKASGKLLVLARKGMARRPTVALRTKLFTDAVMKLYKNAEQTLAETFKKNIGNEIKFYLAKTLIK
jgi:hypothetical protein